MLKRIIEGVPSDNKTVALLLCLDGGGADLVLIQEPWMVCCKVSGLGSPDYKLFVANTQAMKTTPHQQSITEVPLNPTLLGVNNIEWPINSFKPFKSPAHLQYAGNTVINWLQAIFTKVLRTCQIPEPWRILKVVFILVAFLDIEGAFNNVILETITGALKGLGIEGRLVGLINQLLTSRAVTSTLGTSTLTREDWAVESPPQLAP
ncbi:hypothetical protein ACLKA7_011617 [Drosophila subpalustris]